MAIGPCEADLVPQGIVRYAGTIGGNDLAPLMNYMAENDASFHALFASENNGGFWKAMTKWLNKKAHFTPIRTFDVDREIIATTPRGDRPSRLDTVNGFIDHAAYLRLIAASRFPVGDPHDLYFHTPSFAEPGFVDFFRAFHQFAEEVGKVIAFDNPFEISAPLVSREKDRAAQELWNFLTGDFRRASVENWSYIKHGTDGHPYLFLQGNVPYNLVVIRIPLHRIGDPYPDIMRIFNPIASVADKATGLPNWAIFSKTPDSQRILNELKKWDVQINPESMAKIKAIEENFLIKYSERNERFQNIGELLNELALLVDHDRSLKQSFSIETRLAANQLILELAKAYWRWTEANVP